MLTVQMTDSSDSGRERWTKLCFVCMSGGTISVELSEYILIRQKIRIY